MKYMDLFTLLMKYNARQVGFCERHLFVHGSFHEMQGSFHEIQGSLQRKMTTKFILDNATLAKHVMKYKELFA